MSRVFHVTAPDGHTLEITGPPDATEEQAIAQAQAQYKPSSSPAGTLAYKQETARQQFNANAPIPTAVTGLQNLGESAVESAKSILKGLAQNVGAEPVNMTKLGQPRPPGPSLTDLVKGAYRGIVEPVVNYGSNLLAGDPDAAAREGGRILTQTAPAVFGAKELIVNPILDSIPSTTRAGKNFQSVMSKAKDVPIDTSTASDILARAQELRQRGATMPKVMNDFAKAQKPDALGNPAAPLTYEAGRDFASNAGRLSARESMAANPQMQRQVAMFSQAMKEANRGAAESVGMGDLYDSAMKEYRQAKTISEAADTIKKWAVRAAIGGGIGYELWKNH